MSKQPEKSEKKDSELDLDLIGFLLPILLAGLAIYLVATHKPEDRHFKSENEKASVSHVIDVRGAPEPEVFS